MRGRLIRDVSLLVVAAILMARPGVAQTGRSSEREIRREVQWSYDNGERLLVALTDGRQLAGVVTTVDDNTFHIDGEAVAYRTVRMTWRVTENPPQPKPQSKTKGFSEKWIVIPFVVTMAIWLTIVFLAR
jgi:small nuclear ribonucleoprotein (snRNP)-like protein